MPNSRVFPAELLRHLFEQLAKPDLKSARLVCKTWDTFLPASLLFENIECSTAEHGLPKLESISQHHIYQKTVNTLSLIVSSEYGTWSETETAQTTANASRLIACLASFHQLTHLKLIISHDWNDEHDYLTYNSGPVEQILHAPLALTSLCNAHLEWEDSEYALESDFGSTPAEWPKLDTLTLSGYTAASHVEMLDLLNNYQGPLQHLHLQNLRIQDHDNDPESGAWQDLLEALRRDFHLRKCTIRNFYSDLDGVDSGRWNVWKPRPADQPAELRHWPPEFDEKRLESSLEKYVLGAEGNPFEEHMYT